MPRGEGVGSEFTENKGKGFHSHPLDASCSDVRTVPLFPQISDRIPPFSTPSPRVELTFIPRLHSDRGQIEKKKENK